MSAPQANICIYAFTEGSGNTRMTAVLPPLLATAPLYFSTLGDLLIHLKSPATAEDIVLLAPKDAGELADLLPHKRLQDRRLVLILPDDAERTLSLAHLLGPRYLCFADDVGEHLAAVLNKMVATQRFTAASQGAVG